MTKKGIDLLADYVFLSKYSRRNDYGFLETWDETIDRIYSMHEVKLRKMDLWDESVAKMVERAKRMEKEKKILSSQRGRQFASPVETSGILKHEAKLYNCCSTYVDRVEVFSEIMYLLLCGCGVGYSLHREYIDKLPAVKEMDGSEPDTFVVPDSIEGWSDSINALMNHLFNGKDVIVDFSQIRPEGSLIDGKFVAPGPAPIMKTHENIRKVMNAAQGRKLTSIEIHDIICFIAESVVSGGVRRSAMIALFDKDDDLMLTAKTGSWWTENPQRAMANNSILTSKDDRLTYAEMKDKLRVIRQFGEPGIVNAPSYAHLVNPCGEIVMNPSIRGKSGFAFCNLVEINAERVKTQEDFFDACEVAAFVGTVQALYTDFKYISDASRKIADRDRAIGISITGIYANPLLRGKLLEEGANKVMESNGYWAEQFGINRSKACTTIKPSGNASSILGLYCSGIHPAHADKYLRRVRIKTNSPEYMALKDTPMVKTWRGDDAIISFPIEVSDSNVVLKDDVTAVEHLKFIGMVKHYWINKGRIKKTAEPNNISATVEVRDDEWDEVAAVLFTNDYLFAGVSLLPKMGDQIYDNAPFQRLSSEEVKEEYESIKNYLQKNEIDFNYIMSGRHEIDSGEMAVIGCEGGACELKF